MLQDSDEEDGIDVPGKNAKGKSKLKLKGEKKYSDRLTLPKYYIFFYFKFVLLTLQKLFI